MTVRRIVIALLVTYATVSVAAGLVLARFSLRLPRRPLENASAYRTRYAEQFHAQVEDASITAADGASLKAWYIAPPASRGESVILLHGIGDNRIGMQGFADIFLKRGYAVLLPDSRAHGESGGKIATYGLLERDDVRRWVAWLRTRDPGCTYLLGESMGAAIGLEATAVTPQLCAVAVESPYATFRNVAFERLGWQTHLGTTFWRTLGRPAVEVALLWPRLRYGIRLADASPEAAVEHSQVPALLIAGTADHNILMHNARDLARVCGTRCSLWIVPGADHGGASSVEPMEFRQRVASWFATHDAVAGQ